MRNELLIQTSLHVYATFISSQGKIQIYLLMEKCHEKSSSQYLKQDLKQEI